MSGQVHVDPPLHDPGCRRGKDPTSPHYALDPDNCERCRNLRERLEQVHAEHMKAIGKQP